MIRLLVGLALFGIAGATISASAQSPRPRVEVVLQLTNSGSEDQPYVSNIHTLSFSPDGQRVVTGDNNGTVKLWNVADGALIRVLEHPSQVSAVTFSADGRRIVTVSGVARLWDAETGRLVHTFESDAIANASVAISRDGLRFLAGSEDSIAREWEIATGRKIKDYVRDLNARAVTAVAFSPNRQFVLTANHDGTITLWDAEIGQVVRTFEGHELHAASLAFAPDGASAMSVGSDKTIKLWDVATGRVIRTIEHNVSQMMAARFDGTRLLLCCDEAAAVVVDTVEGKVARSFDTGAGYIMGAAFSPDGTQALVSGQDGKLRLLNVDTGRLIRIINEPNAATILSVAFSPDGKRVFAGENGKRIQQWDLSTAQFTRALESSEGWIRSIIVTQDGRHVIGGDGSKISLWEANTGRFIRTFEPEDQDTRPTVVSPDGRHLLAGGAGNGTLSILDAESGRPLRTLTGDVGRVISAVFSADGRRLATSGYEDPIRLWDVASGKLIRTFPATEQGTGTVALSPDGRRIVVNGPNETATMWDADSGKPLAVPPFPSAETYSFSSDDRRLLGRSIEMINLIDLASGRLIVGIPGSIPFDIPVTFLPDGQSFLTGSYDRTLTLRDANGAGIVRTFTGHTAPVIAMAISPDGRRVISGSPDTTLRLWNIESGELLATFLNAADGEWIVVTPEGFFSASPKGNELVRAVNGFDIFPVERFRELLHRPDLVAEKIAGDPRGMVREAIGKLDVTVALNAARQAR